MSLFCPVVNAVVVSESRCLIEAVSEGEPRMSSRLTRLMFNCGSRLAASARESTRA
jgi:hypothetical protein